MARIRKRGLTVKKKVSNYVDWTDQYPHDPLTISINGTRTLPFSDGNGNIITNRASDSAAEPSPLGLTEAAKLSSPANRPNRRRVVIRRKPQTRSATVNTKTKSKEANMATVSTSKTRKSTTTNSATKPAPRTRKARAVAPTVNSIVLKLVKEPSGRGGYKYDNSHLHDEKLDITSMWLSQADIADRFDGEAPDELAI